MINSLASLFSRDSSGGYLSQRTRPSCLVRLERIIAERPEIAVTRHYNRPSAAEFSVLELADIYARLREAHLRDIGTAYSLDLEHSDPIRNAVRKFTAINIAVWEAVHTNATCPSRRYCPLALLLSELRLRHVVLKPSSIGEAGLGDQQAVAITEAIPEAADIQCRLIPADHVVGRWPYELYLEHSKTIPVAVTKCAAVNVAVLISIRAHTVIPLAWRELSLLGSGWCTAHVWNGAHLACGAGGLVSRRMSRPCYQKTAYSHGWYMQRADIRSHCECSR